jgi:creatinine amidohydrolase
MNLQPSTTLAILRDLVESLERSGIEKCLILNSHGGNAFKGHLRELFGRYRVHLFLCNWYTICRDRYAEVFDKPDDHAGEMETSIVLHARPDLVQLETADEALPQKSRFAAVQKGYVELTRPWPKLTRSSGVGDPRSATPDKGKRWLDIIVPPLADFLVELAQSPLDEDFPFLGAR